MITDVAASIRSRLYSKKKKRDSAQRKRRKRPGNADVRICSAKEPLRRHEEAIC